MNLILRGALAALLASTAVTVAFAQATEAPAATAPAAGGAAADATAATAAGEAAPAPEKADAQAPVPAAPAATAPADSSLEKLSSFQKTGGDTQFTMIEQTGPFANGIKKTLERITLPDGFKIALTPSCRMRGTWRSARKA